MLQARCSLAAAAFSLWAILTAHAVQGSQVDGLPKKQVCGCSWSKQHGECTVSAEQFVDALSHDRIDEICVRTYGVGDPSLSDPFMDAGELGRAKGDFEEECKLRWKIKERAKELQRCASKATARDCALDHDCEWNAQGSDRCGVSEQELVRHLLGKNYNHPLARLIQDSESCKNHGEQSCDGERYCVWSWKTRRCDLSPEGLLEKIVSTESIVQTIYMAYHGAQCHAWYEHSPSNQCPQDKCRLEYGFCRAHHTRMRDFETEMLVKICEISFRVEGQCSNPCSLDREGRCMPELRNQDGLQSKDVDVARLLMTLHSGTVFFEHNCNALDHNESACAAVPDICQDGYMPTLSDDDEWHEGDARSDPVIGLKGFLGRFCKVVAEERLPEWLEEYFQDKPKEFLEEMRSEMITRQLDLDLDDMLGGFLMEEPPMKNPYTRKPTPAPPRQPSEGGEHGGEPGGDKPDGSDGEEGQGSGVTMRVYHHHGQYPNRPQLLVAMENSVELIGHLGVFLEHWSPKLSTKQRGLMLFGVGYAMVLMTVAWVWAVRCRAPPPYRSQLDGRRRPISHFGARAPHLDELAHSELE